MSDRPMMFGSPWGKREHDGVIRGEEWGRWADTLHQNTAELVEHLDLSEGNEWQWGLIGDNTLSAHAWANRMGGKGVPVQAALRYVRDRFVPDGTA